MDFRKFYDKTAGHYDRRHDSPASLRLRKKEKRLIGRFATGMVLDVGCGTGYHMDHLGLEIKGIDISDEMLTIARKSGFDVRKASAEHLPFKDNSFNSIFCFFAVFNMVNSIQAVKEMARVLKPGGRVLLSLSSYHDKKSFRISKQRVDLKRLFSKDDLVKLFNRNGFRLEHFDSIFRSGRPRWGDFSRLSLFECANLWLDSFRDQENGVVYLAAFMKLA